MGILLLFMAVLGGIVAWWLSQQRLMTKPWLEEGTLDHLSGGTRASSLPTAKIGLGVFLAVVGTLFSLFITAYSMRMYLGEWRPLPAPRLLWFNTGLLVLSSIALQGALVAANRGRIDGVRAGLFAGGASAVVNSADARVTCISIADVAAGSCTSHHAGWYSATSFQPSGRLAVADTSTASGASISCGARPP